MRASKKLLPTKAQVCFGAMVISWAWRAFRFYSASNWMYDKRRWRCLGTIPPPGDIDFQHDSQRLYYSFSPLADNLQANCVTPDALDKTRDKLAECVKRILEQVDPASREQFKQLRRDVGV